MSRLLGSNTSSVTASSSTSRSVSLTATRVRPRRPVTPESFLTRDSRVGGGGWGKMARRTFPQWEGTLPPRKKRSNARRAHGLGSDPSTEWPVAGATTS